MAGAVRQLVSWACLSEGAALLEQSLSVAFLRRSNNADLGQERFWRLAAVPVASFHVSAFGTLVNKGGHGSHKTGQGLAPCVSTIGLEINATQLLCRRNLNRD